MFSTQVCTFFCQLIWTAFQVENTEDIKYPEPEYNPVNPNEKTTQLAPKSSTDPPTQKRPQHPTLSSSAEAHGGSRLQKATSAISGLPASLQITHERSPGSNSQPLERTGVNSRPRQVPEDDVSEGLTEYHREFAAPYSSSVGKVARFELEPQLSASFAVQTERDQRIAQLTDELALKSALLEQAEANATEAAGRPLTQTSLVEQKDVELVDMQAKLDKLVVSHDEQVGRYEKELTDVRAKLEVKESESAAFRLRLADMENGYGESKAKADTYPNQPATGLVNTDEDGVVQKLLERMQAMEEMASKRWNEKSFEMMECRNED